jgi:hypothetical protein
VLSCRWCKSDRPPLQAPATAQCATDMKLSQEGYLIGWLSILKKSGINNSAARFGRNGLECSRLIARSAYGTTSPFQPGRMNGRFPPICVTSLAGQHVRFGDIGPLG